MTQRDTCIFYRSIYEAIKDLPPNTKLEVYDSVFAFLLDFKEPELQGLSKTIFTLIEPVLRNANKNFVNGNKPKGKRTKSQKEAKDKPTESETEAYKYKDTYDYKDKDSYKDEDTLTDSNESNSNDFTSFEDLETTPPERKKVAQKKEKKTKHLFADSIYAENVDLFISDWNNCSGSISHPEADPIIIYETLKTASNASGYKYISWIDTAINWVKRTPSQFKRTYITQSGKPLHPVEQRMAETLERLNRNSGISNSDGNGYPFTSSQFGDVSFTVPD
jgi:hypothetical protein